MKWAMVGLLLVFGFQALAQEDFSQTPRSYDCKLLVIAKDLDHGNARATFSRPVTSGHRHGGEILSFQFGRNKIDIMADGEWRAIYWYIGSHLVGATLSGTKPHVPINVLMLYNPRDTREFVSLDCMPVYL